MLTPQIVPPPRTMLLKLMSALSTCGMTASAMVLSPRVLVKFEPQHSTRPSLLRPQLTSLPAATETNCTTTRTMTESVVLPSEA